MELYKADATHHERSWSEAREPTIVSADDSHFGQRDSQQTASTIPGDYLKVQSALREMWNEL